MTTAAQRDAGSPHAPAFVTRLERFGTVGSTNDIVLDWLRHGAAEVAVAVADEQSAGRGRSGRSWTAPPGAALLLSLGFRPAWLPPDRAWRLAAIVALAMADAAEDLVGLRTGTIRLKWPNDLVVLTADGGLMKLGGVLGETSDIGTAAAAAAIGIGVNADWPASRFPSELAGSMTSLREASGGRPIDRDGLLAGFLDRLETRLAALRGDRFDVAGWDERQATTNRIVELLDPTGATEIVRAVGVDGRSGALLVEPLDSTASTRAVHAGEIGRLRVSGSVTV